MTIRRRRVAICSVTLWLRKITQSATYSSRPKRVRVRSPCSPVMTAVTPFVLRKRNRRFNSARRIIVVGKAGKERLDGVEHHPLGADGVDGVTQADEKPFQVVFAGLLDLASLDVHVVESELLARHQIIQVETEGSEIFRQFLRLFLERHIDARLVILHRPAHQKLHGKQGFAATGAAADQGRPPQGKAAAGYLVQSRLFRWGIFVKIQGSL